MPMPTQVILYELQLLQNVGCMEKSKPSIFSFVILVKYHFHVVFNAVSFFSETY